MNLRDVSITIIPRLRCPNLIFYQHITFFGTITLWIFLNVVINRSYRNWELLFLIIVLIRVLSIVFIFSIHSSGYFFLKFNIYLFLFNVMLYALRRIFKVLFHFFINVLSFGFVFSLFIRVWENIWVYVIDVPFWSYLLHLFILTHLLLSFFSFFKI